MNNRKHLFIIPLITILFFLVFVSVIGYSSWIVSTTTTIPTEELTTEITDSTLAGLKKEVVYDTQSHTPHEDIQGFDSSNYTISYYQNNKLVGKGSMFNITDPGIYNVIYENNSTHVITSTDFQLKKQVPVFSPSNALYYTQDSKTYEDNISIQVYKINSLGEKEWITISGSFSNTSISDTSDLTIQEAMDSHSLDFSFTFTPENTKYYEKATSSVEFSLKSVAYCGTTYYSRIENAIANNTSSGSNIYVIPLYAETSITIYNGFTINSGVSLILPYNLTYLDFSNGPEYSSVLEGTILPHARDRESSFLKSNVILSSDVKIINKGTLTIGGILNGGNGGHYNAGHTSQDYTQITMMPDSYIDNYGTINCYGYIIENNDFNGSIGIINYSGSTMYIPFIVGEHRGGTIFTEMAGVSITSLDFAPNLKASLFNRFYFNNIDIPMQIYHGAKLLGKACLNASGSPNKTEVELIGSTGIIALSNTNCYVITDYDHNKEIIDLDIYGGAKLNSLVLELTAGFTVKISTEPVFFPISHYFDISLNKLPKQNGNAVYDLISQDIKFLPGAKFTINQGVTVNANKIAIYDTFNDVNTDNLGNPHLYPTKHKDGTAFAGAEFIVNGTLNVSSIGGNILTKEANAQININSASRVSSLEITGKNYKNGFTGTTYYLMGHLYQSGYTSTNLLQMNIGTYLSIQDKNNNCGWVQQKFAIIFDPNNANLLDYEIPNITVQNVDSNNNVIGYELTSDIYPPIDKRNTLLVHYSYRWSLSPNEFVDPAGQTVFETTTLYAIWTPISYTLSEVNYIHHDEEGNLVTQTVTNPSSNPVEGQTFNVLTNYALDKPTTEGLKFSGWYAGIDSTTNELINPVSNFVGANYLSADGTVLPVTLYGYWTYGAPLEIKYEFNGEVPTGISLNSTSVSLRKIKDYSYPTDFNSYYSDYTKASYLLAWSTVKSDGTEEVLTIEKLREYLATLPEGTEVTIKGIWAKKAELQIVGQHNPTLVSAGNTTLELFNITHFKEFFDAVKNSNGDYVVYLNPDVISSITFNNNGRSFTTSDGTTYSLEETISFNNNNYAFYKFTNINNDVSIIDIKNGETYIIYANYVKEISLEMKFTLNLGTESFEGWFNTYTGEYTLDNKTKVNITSIHGITTEFVVDSSTNSVEITTYEGSTYSFVANTATASAAVIYSKTRDVIYTTSTGTIINSSTINIKVTVQR